MKVFNPSKNPLIYGDSKTIDGFGFATGTKEDFQELIDNDLLIIKEEPSTKSAVKKEDLVEEKISEDKKRQQCQHLLMRKSRILLTILANAQ